MKEMEKSHTAETNDLRNEFKREMTRKLLEQKQDMKVIMHNIGIDTPINC